MFPFGDMLKFCSGLCVRESLHERYDRVLFSIGETQVTKEAAIKVRTYLRRRPARDTKTRVLGSIIRVASCQHVTRVVKVHDLLQGFQYTIMHVWSGQVDVAKVWCFESSIFPWIVQNSSNAQVHAIVSRIIRVIRDANVVVLKIRENDRISLSWMAVPTFSPA